MRPEDVPIPERLKRFPLWRGKYVIHYTVYVGPDGVPDFKVVYVEKKKEALAKGLCNLCGTRLSPPFCLIGGELCAENRVFVDGPMHEECAKYAIKVCPFLADPYHGHSNAKPKHAGQSMVIDEVVAGRPKRMALFYTNSYSTIKRGRDWLIEAGPYIKVDWAIIPERKEEVVDLGVRLQ